MFDNPTITDFKTYFVTDFPFNSDPTLGITDTQIGNAFTLVNINFPTNLFSNQGNYTAGYYYLAAHFVVMNARASSQGLSGQYNWLESSKGVGGVSQSFSIPDRILQNPFLSMCSTTNYGSMFILLILPKLCGQMSIAVGTTLPSLLFFISSAFISGVFQ